MNVGAPGQGEGKMGTGSLASQSNFNTIKSMCDKI